MCLEDRIAAALADANNPDLRDYMNNDGYPGDTPAYQGKHERFPTEPQPAASIFDAPDAATEYAKRTAKVLIGEFRMWQAYPELWDYNAAAEWIGRACSILAELAK